MTDAKGIPSRDTIRRAQLLVAQKKAQPWPEPDAQMIFNSLAADLDKDLILTYHALQRMEERSFFVNDARSVLGLGMVEKSAEYHPEKKNYVYLFVGQTLYSGTRLLRCVAAPTGSAASLQIVLITIMWKDEGDWKKDIRKFVQ